MCLFCCLKFTSDSSIAEDCSYVQIWKTHVRSNSSWSMHFMTSFFRKIFHMCFKLSYWKTLSPIVFHICCFLLCFWQYLFLFYSLYLSVSDTFQGFISIDCQRTISLKRYCWNCLLVALQLSDHERQSKAFDRSMSSAPKDLYLSLQNMHFKKGLNLFK